MDKEYQEYRSRNPSNSYGNDIELDKLVPDNTSIPSNPPRENKIWAACKKYRIFLLLGGFVLGWLIVMLVAAATQERCVAIAKANILPDSILSLKNNITGTVTILQSDDAPYVQFYISLQGFDPGATHGMHIHELGIGSTNDCSKTGGHYNPLDVNHGPREADRRNRHFGDLGNLQADSLGFYNGTFSDSIVRLLENNNVLGRAFVIHSGADDIGKGEPASSSVVNGNAGQRIACGNIQVIKTCL